MFFSTDISEMLQRRNIAGFSMKLQCLSFSTVKPEVTSLDLWRVVQDFICVTFQNHILFKLQKECEKGNFTTSWPRCALRKHRTLSPRD